MPRFTVKTVDFSKPTPFFHPCFDDFSTTDLKQSFKSTMAYGFFRKGGMRETLFSGEKKGFHRRKIEERKRVQM